MPPDIEYFTFDLGDEHAGLLRRIQNGGMSIQVISGGRWVDHPDGLKYFEGFGGDQLELVPISESEAVELARLAAAPPVIRTLAERLQEDESGG